MTVIASPARMVPARSTEATTPRRPLAFAGKARSSPPGAASGRQMLRDRRAGDPAGRVRSLDHEVASANTMRVPGGSSVRCGMPDVTILAPIHSGAMRVDLHGGGDRDKLLARHDGDLPARAHLHAAPVPGLARTGLARESVMPRAGNTLKIERDFRDGLRFRMRLGLDEQSLAKALHLAARQRLQAGLCGGCVS